MRHAERSEESISPAGTMRCIRHPQLADGPWSCARPRPSRPLAYPFFRYPSVDDRTTYPLIRSVSVDRLEPPCLTDALCVILSEAKNLLVPQGRDVPRVSALLVAPASGGLTCQTYATKNSNTSLS